MFCCTVFIYFFMVVINQQTSMSTYIYMNLSGWWFQTFFIFHNMWDNPSHWLIFFKMVKANRTMFPANLMGISCLVTLQEQLWLCSARQTTAITPIVTRLFPNIPIVMVYLPEISSLFTCINMYIYINN